MNTKRKTLNIDLESVFRLQDLQTLNLRTASGLMTGDRLYQKKSLQDLLVSLRNLSVIEPEHILPDIDKLTQTARDFGVDKLFAWLRGLGRLITENIDFTLFNTKYLQKQYETLIDELSIGLQCLDEHDYFARIVEKKAANPLEKTEVLLVEDLDYNRVLLRKILDKQNCVVTEAVNGEDAVEQWKEHGNFDLMVMDMNMPVMDGFTATRIIREFEEEKSLKKTPIIALTALAMRGDRELCLEAGCDGYIPKPVEERALITLSKELITGKEISVDDQEEKRLQLDINKGAIKTDNQIYEFALTRIFKKLGLELEWYDEVSTILDIVSQKKYEIIILEAEKDLELAFYLKNNFPEQAVILVTTPRHETGILSKSARNHIQYPFQLKQIHTVLKHHSDILEQGQKRDEELEIADSVSKLKGQVSIEEAVLKSNQQLVVWQKALRKIGGDLVMSHQFNFHGKYGVILGDVAGHDFQSGYAASWFAGLVEGVWGQNHDPYDLLIYLNKIFDHETSEENKRFICALVLLWDPVRSKLHYANSGIPGGILIKKDTGKAELLQWTGMPIGMFPDVDFFDHDSIDFNPGDRLFIATDGVLEAVPSEVISGISEAKSHQTTQQALDSIVDFVTRSIEITDDLTIALFEARDFPAPDKGFRASIQSDFEEIDNTIQKIETFVNENAQDQYDWSMMSIAIREALLNAVEHGNKNIKSLPVDIDLNLTDESLMLNISDCGSGFDLPSEKKRLEKEGQLRIHGRGIEMMENICEKIEYLGGGISMTFTRQSQEAPDGTSQES
jgi:CheY-like chemotaxis protein